MLKMLGALGVGAAMVGADRDVNAVDAGGGVAHGESVVHGSLQLTARPTATVATRTTVSGTTIRLAGYMSGGSIAASTTVHGDAFRSTLQGGHVAASTAVSGASPNLAYTFVHIVGSANGRAGLNTLALRTTVTARLNYTALMAASCSTRTTVTANLIKPRFLTASCAGSTSVTGDATRHILRGHVATRTTAVCQAVINGRFTGTSHGVNHASATLRLALLIGTGTGAGSSLVRARMHSYPTDFTDIHLLTRSTVAGQIHLNSSITSTSHIQGTTTVEGETLGRHPLSASIVASTVVAGRVRFGFGADLFLRTIPHGRLGIRTGINSWRGQTIACKTVVHAVAPKNGFVGTAACRTTLTALITRITAARAVITCSTQFHSHFGGRFAHDGPTGSVNLTSVPRGDMGIPDEISCSTASQADITVERHRMLAAIGNAALSVDKTLVVHGMATAGTGIRQVGTPLALPEKVSRQVTYYV